MHLHHPQKFDSGVHQNFFGPHLICSPEQNRGRGSSPQC